MVTQKKILCKIFEVKLELMNIYKYKFIDKMEIKMLWSSREVPMIQYLIFLWKWTKA